MLVKNYQSELRELNTILENRASKYKQMAFTDNLTGLYNRYKLFELYDVAAFSMSKKGDNMILAVVDIDYFKKINDKYGHDIGDHILVRVSNIFLACLRSTDIVARWGGEEFVFLLTSLTPENAQDLLEKIKDRVRTEKFEIDEELTISIGWTLVQVVDKFDDAFKRADNALYECKESGRNKVLRFKD
jgi:diguanylate cyclase (GGDEF)-like protein